MRSDCFDASNTNTSVAAIPLARASDRMSCFRGLSGSEVYLFVKGASSTGEMRITTAKNTAKPPVAHIHQVRPARLSAR